MIHRSRINASPRLRYSRELQRQKDSTSFLYKLCAALAFLVFLFSFFRGSDSSANEVIVEEPRIETEDVKLPDVKQPERKDGPPVVIVTDENRPAKYKYHELCEDEPELLNEDHKSCEVRLSMIRQMGLTCDDDKNTAQSCCRSCKLKHLTHEHALKKRNAEGDEDSEECLDKPFMLTEKYGDSYSCKKLVEEMFYVGEDCRTSHEAQKKCCHTCAEAQYYEESHCEDYPHLLAHGDCNALFKRLALKRSTCMSKDAYRFCCKTCEQLESLYGESACHDHDYKLSLGTCEVRTLELQKVGKVCDDDQEIAEACCRSCNAHELEGCFDTLYKMDGKTCPETVEVLGDQSDHPCQDQIDLEEKCCRSCDPRRCDDTFELVRGFDCKFNVRNIKALGLSCDDDPEVKANCCHSCSKAFPDSNPI